MFTRSLNRQQNVIFVWSDTQNELYILACDKHESVMMVLGMISIQESWFSSGAFEKFNECSSVIFI